MFKPNRKKLWWTTYPWNCINKFSIHNTSIIIMFRVQPLVGLLAVWIKLIPKHIQNSCTYLFVIALKSPHTLITWWVNPFRLQCQFRFANRITETKQENVNGQHVTQSLLFLLWRSPVQLKCTTLESYLKETTTRRV